MQAFPPQTPGVLVIIDDEKSGSSLLSMLIYAQNDCWQGLEPKIYYR